MLNKIDLETQYKGFNLCFWSMLIIATLAALFGNPITATLLGTLGLVSGAIGQLKLVLINQARIDSKLDVLLEEGVQ